MSERLRARPFGRTLSGVVAFAALAGLVLASTGSTANQPEPTGDTGIFSPAWTPYGVSGAKQTLMVQLSGDPVTVASAKARVELSEAQEDSLQASLAAKQDALKESITALGGTVLGDYQLAYNGIKVSIDPSKASDLARLPGVLGVRTIQKMERDNVRGVQYIGAPTVWGGLSNLHGEGIKIGIIDTGLDYTHANFGGPGTVAAYTAANATDTLPPAPGTFGPRYQGGVDLVGDDYNASAPDGDPRTIPHPDPNPLDCNGHGTHVAGSALGSGVLSTGAEYTGAYNETTISGNTWRIAPGVAPEADIYAIRVFGCTGSTDVTVDAIEWAVDNDLDVINMSLGSSFGKRDDPSAVASTNAAIAGVIVVTSAGNSGPNQYITGSPGTAEGAISTAAQDVWETIPGVRVQTSAGLDLQGINANGYSGPWPVSGPLIVLQDNPATTTDEPGRLGSADESLGCSVSAYTFNGVGPGEIGVAKRGACARVAKAIFGDQAGAAAVIMTNNAASLPPFEGQITSNPDTGEPYVVDIPFVGVAGNQDVATTDSGRLRASPPGTTVTLSPIDLPNANFRGFASFTSGGPRNGDSFLKPDVTAPGVSIISAANGSGNGASILSGTSMASPHNAGATALVRQAHPTWSVSHIKAAVVNTADPGLSASSTTAFRISRGGTGTIQVAKSTATQVVAYAGDASAFDVAVNYGFRELGANFVQTRTINLENNGTSSATFDVTAASPQGSPHTVAFPDGPTVTVPAGGRADVEVTLTVPAATAGTSTGTTANPMAFQEVAGLVTFTPQVESNNGVALRVPYYLVPRALSKVEAAVGAGALAPGSTASISLTNGGVIPGAADFYAWGISDADDSDAMADSSADVRAVGVQSFPGSAAGLPATERLLVFAVNTWDRWSNAATNEFDILVDVDPQNANGDDYEIVGADQGAIQTGTFNGRMAAFVFSTRSTGSQVAFFATAPTDSSTALLPIRTGHLCRTGQPCLNEANPRFTYRAASFDLDDGGSDTATGSGSFNAWTPSITTGGSETVAPGATGTEDVTIDAAEWANTPALGLMIVVLDNQAGADEAKLIPATAAAPVAPPPPPPVQIPAPVADMQITKSGTPGTVTAGGNVTYTLTVRNAGPSTATGVVAADQLPVGATFVSATSTQGACSQSGGVVTCNIGTMASGATVTITVVVTMTTAGTFANVATVVSNVGDSNAANNTATVTTTVQAPPREPAARPAPAVCRSLAVTPRQIKVARRTTVTARVRLSNGRPMANAQVRFTAPGISVTRRTNAQGIARFTVRPKRAGIARVTVLRSPRCTAARVGIVGVVVQPPITG